MVSSSEMLSNSGRQEEGQSGGRQRRCKGLKNMHLEVPADAQNCRHRSCRAIPPSLRKGIPTLCQLKQAFFTKLWPARDRSVGHAFRLLRLPLGRRTALLVLFEEALNPEQDNGIHPWSNSAGLGGLLDGVIKDGYTSRRSRHVRFRDVPTL